MTVAFLMISMAAPAGAAERPRHRTRRDVTLPNPTRQIVYKTSGSVKLKLHVFEPQGRQATGRRPAIVFFFGGGWASGTAPRETQKGRASGILASQPPRRVRTTSPHQQ
ncbi:hypothetical protein AMJ85_01430 [candidate division BRC1 bacterium SM23_51]|nr:MAG: hypothetical protein AMJ85_01430 [candidate division BRC1 bacterium SM23_51]